MAGTLRSSQCTCMLHVKFASTYLPVLLQESRSRWDICNKAQIHGSLSSKLRSRKCASNCQIQIDAGFGNGMRYPDRKPRTSLQSPSLLETKVEIETPQALVDSQSAGSGRCHCHGSGRGIYIEAFLSPFSKPSLF